MGLLGDVLLAPVMGPVRGLRAVLEAIQDQANTELFDEQHLQEELIALNMRLELGELTEAEFAAQEAVVLEQLKAIRAARAEAAQGEREGDGEGEAPP
jgi:hypothetical protein